MKEKNVIIDFTSTAINNISNLDDIIDKALEPIKDFTDTFGDLIAPIKTTLSIISLSKKLRFKSFLKSYSKCITTNYHLDDDEILRLQKYFSNPDNVHWVADVIDNAILSRSLKSASLLGLITGRIIKDKTPINDNDIIIIKTLKELTDIDISNFKVLYRYINKRYINTSSFYLESNLEIRSRDFYDSVLGKSGNINVDKFSLDLTIERLKRTEALSYGEGGLGSVGNAKGAFTINPITNQLYLLLEKANMD